MVVQDFSFCVTNQTGDCDCGVAVVRLGEVCVGGRGVAVTSTCVRSPPADAAQRSSNPPPHPAGDTRGYSRRWEGGGSGAVTIMPPPRLADNR